MARRKSDVLRSYQYLLFELNYLGDYMPIEVFLRSIQIVDYAYEQKQAGLLSEDDYVELAAIADQMADAELNDADF